MFIGTRCRGKCGDFVSIFIRLLKTNNAFGLDKILGVQGWRSGESTRLWVPFPDPASNVG